MRHARALLPFLAAALAVVLLSAGILAPVVTGPKLVTDATLEPTAAASPPAADLELSPSGRVAFWREVGEAAWELWAADLDGRRRIALLREPRSTSVGLTRWSPDGSTLAYTRGATTLVVAALDGRRVVLPAPPELVENGWKIGGFHWSPRGTRIAVTLQAQRAGRSESAVFVVPVRAGAEWMRLSGGLPTAAGPWISDEALLVEIGPGVIAIAEATTLSPRPIIAIPAASPLLHRDGRVYFHGSARGGRATGGAWAWAGGVIWSATIDGDDLRPEAAARFEEARIEGRLADGRFVVAAAGSMYLAGEGRAALPWRAGNVRRVVVSDDGRDAIGIADTRIVRFALARIPREPGLTTPGDAFSTVLDGVREADVWLPRSPVTPLRLPEADDGGPPARLAFVLAGMVCEIVPGGMVRTRTLAAGSGHPVAANWSPAGDRLAITLTVESEGARPGRAAVAVLGPDGELWRVTAQGSGSMVTWSADGRLLALTTFRREGATVTATTELLDAETGAVLESIDGAGGQWTRSGLLLRSEGTVRPGDPPLGRTIEIVQGGVRRRITDAETLAADPRLAHLGPGDRPAHISFIQPSADGSLIGAYVSRPATGRPSPLAYVVLRAADGAPVAVDPLGPTFGLTDLSLSPTAPLLVRTVLGSVDHGAPGGPPPSVETGDRVLVHALDGRVVFERPGRFGGWSPDGSWIYVARPSGLFAYPLAGGEGVRVSAMGVRVHAAPR